MRRLILQLPRVLYFSDSKLLGLIRICSAYSVISERKFWAEMVCSSPLPSRIQRQKMAVKRKKRQITAVNYAAPISPNSLAKTVYFAISAGTNVLSSAANPVSSNGSSTTNSLLVEKSTATVPTAAHQPTVSYPKTYPGNKQDKRQNSKIQKIDFTSSMHSRKQVV